MEDIEELSKRLLNNDYFIRNLKQRMQQFSKQKNYLSDQQIFIKPLPQSPTLQLNQKFMELTQQPRFSQQRPSITSSAFDKRQSRDSISSLSSNPIFQQYIQTYSMTQGHTINALTTQITNSLSQMVKRECENFSGKDMIGLTVGMNNENISQIIQNLQEIQKEQIASVKESLQEKLETLKSQIEFQVLTIIQKLKLQRKAKKINEKSSLIKKQRKKVTQSILDLSKNNQQMSTFSNIHEIDNILSNSEQQESQSSIARRNSPEISQLSSKITQVQRSQIKISKQFEQRFLKQVEQNKKDIQTLTEKIIQWKLKNQQKLENGFTGVWNVVTDIEDKMNRVTLRVVEIQHTLS